MNIKGKKDEVSINIRYKEVKDGRKSVYLDISCRGIRNKEYLKLYIMPENTPADVKANKKTMKQVEAILKIRKREWKNLTAENKHIDTKLTETSEKDLPFAEWLKIFKDIQVKKGARDINAYDRLISVIKRFDDTTKVKDIDLNFCRDYLKFIQTELFTTKGKPLSSKTLFGYCCTFTNALNTAVRNELLAENPMNKLNYSEKIHPKEAPRDFLTIEELKLMVATNPRKEKYLIVKQAYLFACNCGLRLGDIRNLKWKDIYQEKGKWMLATTMQKSIRPVYIPLGEQAMRWLPQREHQPDDNVFDLPFDTTINNVLTEMAEDAGITNKRVTFHTSRHTFATMLITLNVDIYTTSKLLGHSDVRITERYAKIVDQQKDATVALLDNIE